MMQAPGGPVSAARLRSALDAAERYWFRRPRLLSDEAFTTAPYASQERAHVGSAADPRAL